MTEALNLETRGSKEYDKFSDVAGFEKADRLITLPTDELNAVYSRYFIEKKSRMDALKEEPQYAEDCETIKIVSKAERDRIAPEKNLFDLALVVLEGLKNGEDEWYVRDSKAFKKAERTSGTDYVLEFIRKPEEDIKNYCIRFYMLQRQVKAELEANIEYMSAKERKKSAEADIKEDLHYDELASKLALVELKNRSVEPTIEE